MTKQNVRRLVVITRQTHDKLRAVAKEQGMKQCELADRILASWFAGRIFVLGQR